MSLVVFLILLTVAIEGTMSLIIARLMVRQTRQIKQILAEEQASTLDKDAS